jgi:predicted secreted hydrolase
MEIDRRAFVASLLAAHGMTGRADVTRRALRFPADFGSHDDQRVEWWYITGALQAGRRTHGFQITFFRVQGEPAAASESRFAVRQLVFAHAAVTDMAAGRLRHDQRIARAGFGIAEAETGQTRLQLRDWSLQRHEAGGRGVYRSRARSELAGFAFDLGLATTQPLLLQGDAGYSRKGPRPEQASCYYSEPQLEVDGTLTLAGRTEAVTGRAWLDHEWSDSVLDREAVGWDWIGMNLAEGGALTAFRVRRADGSPQWAGGSHRPAGGAVRSFGADEVAFTPLRSWTSPATRAVYPVEWRVDTPVGRFSVRSRLDAQELDSRGSSGAVYWEGLSDLLDAQGRAAGRGYLEMTGYAGALKL